MTKLSIATAITAALCSLPAMAQLAPPQWTRPAMDSTHVTGTAERVMPEIPTPASKALEETSDQMPRTVAELLAAFDGVVLDMPGNESAGAFGQLRFRFSRQLMQTQFTSLWNWYDGCTASAAVTRCAHGNLSIMLSPDGLSVVRNGCNGMNGSAGGSAEFTWKDFVSYGGSKSPNKHWTLLRDTFWTSCYVDVGSND